MLRIFTSALNTLYDSRHTKQLHFFYAWLRAHGLGTKKILLYLSGEPVVYTARGKVAEQHVPYAFIACLPHTREAAFAKSGDVDSDAWRPLFQSATLELWENVTAYTVDNLPLRCGITEQDKKQLLAYARAVIAYTLGIIRETPRPPDKNRFREIYNVDVAVWVNGNLRASHIEEQTGLIDGVTKAAQGAVHDPRFKPLAVHEYTTMRVEITLWDNLYLPPYQHEIANDIIYPHIGYVTVFSKRKGWFLPEVHNCRSFTGLRTLGLQLAIEKAGVSTNYDTVCRSLFLFAVQDCIESPTHAPLTLHGPVVSAPPIETRNVSDILNILAERSIDFLGRIQEIDGNIPPRIHPFSGKIDQVDWVRLALTTWALAFYGKETAHSTSTKIALDAFRFLTTHLFAENTLPAHTRSLALIYTDFAASILDHTYTPLAFIDAIQRSTNIAHLEKIHKALYAHFLLIHHEHIPNALSESIRHTHELYDAFCSERTHKGPIATATYPELIRLLKYIAPLAPAEFPEKTRTNMLEWYSAMRLPNGAFPENTHVGVRPYVRGTAKIFEVLADLPEYSETEYAPTVRWILAMQYTPANSFFIRPEMQRQIVGGFRHDALNPSVWIDANAHVLIGIARLISRTQR